MVSQSDIMKAMLLVEASRKTHEDYIEWYDAGHTAQESLDGYFDSDPEKFIGDRDWHQLCVDEYDFVLDVLRKVLNGE